MSNDVSVAPKERVNITYKAATGDAQAEVELPFKMLMLGDYSGKKDETPLEERKAISIDKDNFNSVLKSHGIEMSFNVANKLSAEEGEEMSVALKIENMRDFEPESVASQIPEVNQLIELRNALTALKGPLGNVPAFRRKLEQMMLDDELRQKLLDEITKS
ncbi:MAG: type VI secretion system contractile sheath small subunit [Gammaproteobacteria bacterium]|nr:type VI secretion system contractile sheath small subunit [Gammaproteobacteria bacterium]